MPLADSPRTAASLSGPSHPAPALPPAAAAAPPHAVHARTRAPLHLWSPKTHVALNTPHRPRRESAAPLRVAGGAPPEPQALGPCSCTSPPNAAHSCRSRRDLSRAGGAALWGPAGGAWHIPERAWLSEPSRTKANGCCSADDASGGDGCGSSAPWSALRLRESMAWVLGAGPHVCKPQGGACSSAASAAVLAPLPAARDWLQLRAAVQRRRPQIATSVARLRSSSPAL